MSMRKQKTEKLKNVTNKMCVKTVIKKIITQLMRLKKLIS